MSYARAYPNRPTRQSMVPQHNKAHVPPGQPAGQKNATEPELRQLEHCGAYAMLKPDQAKRDKIMRTADAETKAYEQYKQRPKKVQYHTTTGTVGGGSYNTQSSSRHQAGVAPQRPAPRPGLRSSGASVPKHNIQPCVKKPALKTQTARIDDAEIARHKATQRQKAQTLTQKQKVRQNQLDEDRLRKNNDFLDRLEAKR